MSTFNIQQQPLASPHAHSGESVPRTMLWVKLALLPATLFGFWLYGWPAFNLWLLTLLSCLFWETCCLRLAKKPVRPNLLDGSALLTGWLLALTLPPWAPAWTAVVGGFMAVVIGKQVFGGLGQNVFNPAMVARVGLLISFPVTLTQWISPAAVAANRPSFVDGLRITLGEQTIADGLTSASLLGYSKTELSRGVDLLSALSNEHAPALSWLGERAGSMGESSAILIALGGLVLLFRQIISWHIPATMLAGVLIPAWVAHGLNPERFLDVSHHLFSGSLILGAFFIATDYVTSPTTGLGKIIFGFGCGLLTFVIRTWGGYPEGVAFAVLLMNAMTPLIDRFTAPRILGRDRRGRPLGLPS